MQERCLSDSATSSSRERAGGPSSGVRPDGGVAHHAVAPVVLMHRRVAREVVDDARGVGEEVADGDGATERFRLHVVHRSRHVDPHVAQLGDEVAAGSSRVSFPCSTSIMMATLVIGLDIE